MTAAYAAKTEVSVESSRAEIERTLRRYKADAFGYSTDSARATVAFRIGGRHVLWINPAAVAATGELLGLDAA